MIDNNVSVRGLSSRDLLAVEELCNVMDEYPETGMTSYIYGEIADDLCSLKKGRRKFPLFWNLCK